ncbi:unnamed protein product [Callosobruchus maculatus]|uniref:Uncharacterized protein n=1 Tax=Callosobruchus maculatus TaxID=64391 RepID=A0A653BHB3_CALMS|nr:unnamed protein product [Callosobruchus maculatus]
MVKIGQMDTIFFVDDCTMFSLKIKTKRTPRK